MASTNTNEGRTVGSNPSHWIILTLASVGTLVLGVSGFIQGKSSHLSSWLDAVYSTFQLFVLSGPASGPLDWRIQLARFLAPAITVYTAALALLLLYHRQLRLLRLRFLRNHVVICGLGRLGFRLASDSRKRGLEVVAIELDEDNDWIPLSESLGVTVLLGDASETSLLDQACIRRAAHLILVCPQDSTNVEIAIQARGIFGGVGKKGPNGKLICHTHMVDDDLRSLFKQHQIFTNEADQVQIRLFNVYDSIARIVLAAHPLDRPTRPQHLWRSIRLIVVGLGKMGESMVLQAARIGHFASGKGIEITVLDQDAARRERSFRRRNPCFSRVCPVEFIQADTEDPLLIEQIASRCREPDVSNTVAICFDDDARCLTLALSLLPELQESQTPILVRMDTDEGLTSLLESGGATNRLRGLIRPFPILPVWSDRGMLLEPQVDSLARAIHENYRQNRMQEGITPSSDPALNLWDLLDEDFKDSNRHQADHIPVKLRAIGCQVWEGRAANRVNGFTVQEIDILAKMEHKRWVAERLLAGWTPAAGPKNLALKTSPHLTEWEKLDPEIQEYDREAVRLIPKLLEASGYSIVRSV